MNKPYEAYIAPIGDEKNARILKATADAILGRVNTKLAAETGAREQGDAALRLDLVALQGTVAQLQQIKIDTKAFEQAFKDWLGNASFQQLIDGLNVTVDGAKYSIASVVGAIKPIVETWAVVARDADLYPPMLRAKLKSGQICLWTRAVDVLVQADAQSGVLERRKYTYSCPDFAGQAVEQSLTVDMVPVTSDAEPGLVLWTNPQLVETSDALFDMTALYGAPVTLAMPAIDADLDGIAGYPAPTPAPVPAPVDPTPVDPAPVDPTPVDPAPVDPAPVDPAPVDPTPVDPAPVDPAPVDPGVTG